MLNSLKCERLARFFATFFRQMNWNIEEAIWSKLGRAIIQLATETKLTLLRYEVFGKLLVGEADGSL